MEPATGQAAPARRLPLIVKLWLAVCLIWSVIGFTAGAAAGIMIVRARLPSLADDGGIGGQIAVYGVAGILCGGVSALLAMEFLFVTVMFATVSYKLLRKTGGATLPPPAA